MNLERIKKQLIKFRKDRNWEQYHDPKNLAIALSIEANELLEHFLWVKKIDIENFTDQKKEDISKEIADVFIYLYYICYGLEIDLEKSVLNKISQNAVKYPRADNKELPQKILS